MIRYLFWGDSYEIATKVRHTFRLSKPNNPPYMYACGVHKGINWHSVVTKALLIWQSNGAWRIWSCLGKKLCINRRAVGRTLKPAGSRDPVQNTSFFSSSVRSSLRQGYYTLPNEIEINKKAITLNTGTHRIIQSSLYE